MKLPLVLATLVLNTLALAKAKPFVVLTPNEKGFSCEIRPEQNPPVVENDLIKFVVKVKGGHGPYQWRLPLYKANNGANDVSLARVGAATPSDEGTFIIDLNVMDLQKIMKEEIALLLESKERFQARCATPSALVRTIASSQRPKELEIIEGSLVPR